MKIKVQHDLDNPKVLAKLSPGKNLKAEKLGSFMAVIHKLRNNIPNFRP